MVVPMIQAVYHSMSNFASKYDSNVNFIHFKEQSSGHFRQSTYKVDDVMYILVQYWYHAMEAP